MKKALLTSLFGVVVAGVAITAIGKVITTDIKPMSTSNGSAKFSGYVSNNLLVTAKTSGTIKNSTFPKEVKPNSAPVPFTVTVPKSSNISNPEGPIFFDPVNSTDDSTRCSYSFAMNKNQQLVVIPWSGGKFKCEFIGNTIIISS